jgi:opacity protein-like surface antigen
MNSHHSLRYLACTAALLAAPLCHADGTKPESRWYFQAGIGAAQVEDSEVTLDFTSSDRDISFDSGPRLDVLFGYRLNPKLALEFESGFSANEISSISGEPGTRGDIYLTPMLVNLAWRPFPEARVAPLLGIGAGLNLGWLDIDEGNLQGASLYGVEGAAGFAGQLFTGLDFQVNDQVRVGAVYKFVMSSSLEWDLASFDPNRDFGVIRVEDPTQHSVLVTVTFDF